jgi:hypothetical protein
MLTEGDLILQKDQYYDYSNDQWVDVEAEFIGLLYNGPYGYYHFLVIRRKNKKKK